MLAKNPKLAVKGRVLNIGLVARGAYGRVTGAHGQSGPRGDHHHHQLYGNKNHLEFRGEAFEGPPMASVTPVIPW